MHSADKKNFRHLDRQLPTTLRKDEDASLILQNGHLYFAEPYVRTQLVSQLSFPPNDCGVSSY
eukprot:6187352-Pleurochrysis_carterae.AAC.3